MIGRVVGALLYDWSCRNVGGASRNVIGSVLGLLCCDWSLGRDVIKVGGAGKPPCSLLDLFETFQQTAHM